MSFGTEVFTIGVEEEYQIIDPVTRKLSSSAAQILPHVQHTLGSAVQPEIHLSQIEIATPICQTLSEVRRELTRLRREVIAAARHAGKVIAAAGTHPFSHWKEQQFTYSPRYIQIEQDYQQLAREQAIFGCHVHIGLDDPEAAIQVINRLRLWLTTLLALAANSPFWLGEDTGYASFRTEIWSRWPLSGPPCYFESLDEYNALTQSLLTTKSIDDKTKIYWDVRLSERFKTVEIRVMDVCMTVDEAVMLTGLVRALIQTCYQQTKCDVPCPAVRPELLRAAHWRAARYGLSRDLVDFESQSALPASVMIEKLLTFVRPALEAEGDWNEVSQLVYQTLQQGNGATRQRELFKQTAQVEHIVDFIIMETAKGTDLL